MKIKESIMIYPAEQTPKSSISLSSIDLRGRNLSTNIHTHLLFIYENANKTESQNTFFDTSMLKSTLSRVLVPFYPVAGRLRKRDDSLLEIDCNAEGVLFVEAETTYTLSDFGKYFIPNEVLRKLVCPTYDSSKGISSVPLLMVQLTRFGCGGVCLNFALDHQVGDGVSMLHLLKSWAKLARHLDLIDLPTFDRSYLAARDPPVVEFDHLDNETPLPPFPPPKDSSGETIATIECIFELTQSQINALKEEAASPALTYNLSTYEVVAAHVWRCVTKARGLANNQDIKLYIAVDGRKRLKNPSLPDGYFGNAVFFVTCNAKVEDVILKPLWHVASRIHEVITEMSYTDYLRSTIDYMESRTKSARSIIHVPQSVCPNLSLNSWGAFPFHEIDFGEGAPKLVRHSGIRFEGQSYLIPSTQREASFSLAIKLYKPHMHLFKSYFLLENKFHALGRL